ncbi:hypothetical protein FQN60_009183, partial [Etheostoma spectabile]
SQPQGAKGKSHITSPNQARGQQSKHRGVSKGKGLQQNTGRLWRSGLPGQRARGSTMGNVVQRVNVVLGERGDRLTRAEDKTVELMHKTQQFADSAH